MSEEEMPTYGELYAENFRLKHNERILQNRIDKAIEYIKTNVKEHEHDDYDITLYYALNQNECDELLAILRGKDEN